LSSGGETSREVAKRPGIETSKGAKRPGGETSRWQTIQVVKHPGSKSSKVVVKRLGDELEKRPITEKRRCSADNQLIYSATTSDSLPRPLDNVSFLVACDCNDVCM